MIQKTMTERVSKAYAEGRRLVAPLMGFPGLRLTGCTIKLAQQNYGEHYKVLKSLVERFKPDMVFPLMDLALEANALGRHTLFPKQDTAVVVKDRFEIADLDLQKEINISFVTRLCGYVETMKLMSIGFPGDVLRGGYVTGPYSLAALIMGAQEAAMATVADTGKLEQLCQFTTSKIQEYVRLLIASGVQVIMVLEPSAVMLGPPEFERFSSRFVRNITDSCRYTDVATVYHTCGNTMHLIEKMAEAEVDAISLDSPEVGVDLKEAAERVKGRVILFGNINPTGSIFSGKPREVKEEVRRLLKSMDQYPGFVLSTGCDLPQEVPLENLEAFMEAGRSHRTGE